MSLRDQLLKAGVVDRKTVRRVNQELEQDRKKGKAERDSRREIELRAEAAAKAERDARVEALLSARRERQLEAERQATVRQASQLVGHYQIRVRGGNQPFWHLTPARTHAHRLLLPERLAWDLCRGNVGIAWTGKPDDPQYILLPADITRRVLALMPSLVLFFNDEPADRDDPALRLYDAHL